MILLSTLALATVSAQAQSAYLAAFDVAGATERKRAERFGRQLDRLSYQLAHGFLRHVLAQEAGCDPEELRLSVSANGKPICPGGPFFNMSHTADWIAVAVSSSRDVGLDVEAVAATGAQVHRVPMAVAAEDEGVLPLLDRRREQAETMLWSIKEAALKLTGEVMTDPGHMAVRRRRDGLFHVSPSRAARAPFHDAFVRQVRLGDTHVLSLATYEPVPASQITVSPECWHGPPGPNIQARVEQRSPSFLDFHL
ncbi:4'-phosphopantetheinyl transferase family protein [Microvirga rosea]|uniref:4'-phosphopantetheinyl transferase family protein n=1 Tax=Microvirga rosea TaxID=2715425 RepID=UPI001D0A6EEA|nr:hypothetical protein [Microvirga rosea]MCB8821774.1 hypothetical protein [Microvirga rosea]